MIPAPYWVSYADMALLAGGVPKLIPSNEASGFRIKPDQLQTALTPNTRVFFLNSPCNPTGATYDRDELLAIAGVLEKHDCLILADDIYEKIIYDGFEVHNIVTLCPGAQGAHAHRQRRVQDLRHDRLAHRLRPRPERCHRRRRQNPESKHVESDFHRPSRCFRGGTRSARSRSRSWFGNFTSDATSSSTGSTPSTASAAVNPKEPFTFSPISPGCWAKAANGKKLNSPCDVAEYLLEEAKVAGVPGEDFGSHQHIRFSYATSLDDIEKGCARIRQAAAKA